MRFTFMALPLALLAGCTEPGTPAEPAPPTTDSCGAAAFEGLVGQPKTALDRMTLPEGARVIGPNQPVTMDFRPTRLNIEIGKDDRIARVGCY